MNRIQIQTSVFEIHPDCLSAINDALAEIRKAAPEGVDTREHEITILSWHCEECPLCRVAQ